MIRPILSNGRLLGLYLFVLAVLSFTDARPRGSSEVDFNTKDEFNVGGFLQCLSFGKSGLHFRADYIRGRCLKTDITIRPDGSATLTTWGRGQAALRWLDRLKGKSLWKYCRFYSNSENRC